MKVKRLHPDAILPTRKYPTDAGLDLYSLETYDVKDVELVRTGIALEIPEGYFGLIKPKSRDWFIVGAGVVDSGYQGEIKVKIINVNTKFDLTILKGQAVAQLVLIPIITPELELVNDFEVNTFRGKTGGINELI